MEDFYYVLDKFLNGKYAFTNIEENNLMYPFYQDAILFLDKNNIDRLSYRDIITKLNNSNLTKIFYRLLKDYKYELVVKSDIHGLSHIIRTSILLLIISIYENVNKKDFTILLESILYHDIGRINDIDDDLHGYNATKKITFLKEKYNESDYNYICAIITGHSIDDEKFEHVANQFNIEDTARFLRLLSIVKDADALDRVREYPYTDIKYLRTLSSKRIICLSYELYNSYYKNLKQEPTKILINLPSTT